ncbi:MAG TPA: RNA polymerase sigma-70 factor [Chitinophaga sp.]
MYDRYKELLQSHACRQLDDFEEVKDILQDTFATLWAKRNELPVTENLSGYLYITIRNKIFNRFARRQSRDKYIQSLQSFVDKGDFITDHQVRARELELLIQQEINALPPKMKAVFLLSRQAGYSHREIADEMGIAEQTVSKQITNALKVLKVKLGVISILLFFLFF